MEEVAISNYVQTADGTKLDLKFEALETTHTALYVARDSAKEIKLQLKTISDARIRELTREINRDTLEMELTKVKWKYEDYAPLKKNLADRIELYKQGIAFNRKMIKAYSTDFAQTDYSEVYQRMKSYEGDSSTVFLRVYECRYRVFNPQLNTTQEMKGRFYLTPDLAVVKNHDKIDL
jgi:hypothetical protein